MQLAEIESPQHYLGYFEEIIEERACQEIYPSVFAYYQNLCSQFEEHYSAQNTKLFQQFSTLLAIDAQLQILIEFLSFNEDDCFIESFGEEAFIQMVQADKNSYYRELAGFRKNHQPPWGMIFLSEEV